MMSQKLDNNILVFFNQTKIDFYAAGTDEQRAIIIRKLLLKVGSLLGLIKNDGRLIDVVFEEMDCLGLFKHKDVKRVYLSKVYITKDCNFKSVVSTYLHECAHLFAYERGYDSAHKFLFYIINLAISLRFDTLIKNESIDFKAYWMQAAIRLYDLHEEYDFADVDNISYEKLSDAFAVATKIAFKTVRDNQDSSVRELITKLCKHYNNKLAQERAIYKEIEKRKEFLLVLFARGAFASACIFIVNIFAGDIF